MDVLSRLTIVLILINFSEFGWARISPQTGASILKLAPKTNLQFASRKKAFDGCLSGLAGGGITGTSAAEICGGLLPQIEVIIDSCQADLVNLGAGKALASRTCSSAFFLETDEASELCVSNLVRGGLTPTYVSGRCPAILKANKQKALDGCMSGLAGGGITVSHAEAYCSKLTFFTPNSDSNQIVEVLQSTSEDVVF